MSRLIFNIGHGLQSNGTIDPGAPGCGGMTEYEFNCRLAVEISVRLKPYIEAGRVQFVHQDQTGYGGLPARLNSLMPDCIVSLHCNSFNDTATGTEVLYYYSSQRGKALANSLRGHLTKALQLPDRGSKPLGKNDRGGGLLYHTAAPCIIAEPFFISNKAEYEYVIQNFDALAQAYADFAIELLTQ